jgi:hypothetical protein
VVVVVALPPTVLSQGAVSNLFQTFSGSVGFQAPATNGPEKTAATTSIRGFDALEVDTVVVDELDEVLRAQMGSYEVKFQLEVLSGVSIARALLTGTKPGTLLAQGSGVTPVATLVLRTGANLPAVPEPTENGTNPATFLISPVPDDVLPSPAPKVSSDAVPSETSAPQSSSVGLVWGGITILLGIAAGVLQRLAHRRADSVGQ